MKALIAEDDLYTRKALATILESEGWTVTACADGREALSRFADGGYGLVCLDIMMPRLSGYDVCREIRARDRTVPVLFISAKSEEIDTVLGLELGADDFIVKPFGVRELQARIHALLRRNRADPPAATAESDFAFGPWEVRPSELRAVDRETVVELSAREVSILRLLLERRGKVVSREEFFRQCWRLDQAPLSRTLDQHIARLRRKIDTDPARPLIRTVQCAGYRHE